MPRRLGRTRVQGHVHQRQTAVLPIITASSAVLNVAANLVLIPLVGTMGAAWATLIAFTLMAATTYVAAQRAYPVALDWVRLALMFGMVIGAVAFVSLRRQPLSVSEVALDAALSLGVAAIASLAALRPVRHLRELTRSAAREAATESG